jgi:hypothetical protein
MSASHGQGHASGTSQTYHGHFSNLSLGKCAVIDAHERDVDA